MLSIRKFTAILVTLCLPAFASASTSDELQTAASGGKVAFVLVTDPTATGTDQARMTIQSTMAQVPGSVLIESDRTNAANSAFVQKHGLASAPVPLILVFGANGAIAGGNVARQLMHSNL